MLDIVELSRLQFALTAMYHFLFVPLTLGMAFLLAIMETVYVLSGKQIYKDMTKFWGKLFGINFALGVATGLTMEFQFGTNWSYYSHYVGDIFGAPLAIEGLMAFFLESTFVGLFFFGFAPLIDQSDLFREISGVPGVAGRFSITIRGLPRIAGLTTPAIPSANGGFSLNDITPAAGGDDTTTETATNTVGNSLDQIAPAAGGNVMEANSWNAAIDAAEQGQVVNYSFAGDGSDIMRTGY